MPPGGYRRWTTGETITGALLNDQIADQVVNVFASAAARDAGITAPFAGQMAIVVDGGSPKLTTYDGAAWRWLRGGPDSYATAGARNTANPTPVPGQITYDEALQRLDVRRGFDWMQVPQLFVHADNATCDAGGVATIGYGVSHVAGTLAPHVMVQAWRTDGGTVPISIVELFNFTNSNCFARLRTATGALYTDQLRYHVMTMRLP